MRWVAGLLLIGACLHATAEQRQRVIELWPDRPPETQRTPTELSITERGDPAHVRDRYAKFVTDPNLVVFPAANPNGQALLIIPGGGYQRVVMDKEGYEAAQFFSKRGATCFVLMYRLPGDSWTNRSAVPLQDAQRSLRLVRDEAATYGYDTSGIGVMGFSAGGHVAASLATAFARSVYTPTDAADSLSARPDFAVLLYPVVSMESDIAHAGSRENLLGPGASHELELVYSVEHNVAPDTPPVFLLHAADDEAVAVENSIRLYKALRSADIPVDMHIYSVGGHGFGMRYATDKPVVEWPKLVWRWMQAL